MATISLLSRLVGGVQRQVDFSVNTLWVQDLQLNNSSGWTLAGVTSLHPGSSLIGDDSAANPYTNFTASAPTVRGALRGIDTALASSGSIQLDGTFRIENTSDPTKKIAFDASGISTATTRTILMPDSNVNLGLIATAIQRAGTVAFTANQPMGGFKLTGLGAGTTAGDSVRYEQAILISGVNAWAANQSLGGFLITNSGTPLAPGDLTNKLYVDNIAQGLNWKQTARSATTAALPANTYNNGTAGVGATLTANANGALPAQDGVTLVVGNRLLVKNEATSANNGIYVVSDAGSGGTPYILTRSTDANTAVSLQWATLEISPDASTQAGYIYRESNDITTIGTDAVAFILVSHGLDWVFSDGLTVTGNTVKALANPTNPSIVVAAAGISVNLNAAGAIVTSASGLLVQLAGSNPGLAITANALDVKYGAAIVASASGIAWNPDGSSLEVSSNAARIKTTAYDQATITGGGGSAAAVAYAPAIKESMVVGESFAATTLFAVRYAKAADSGFVAGRVYKADYDSTSADNFWAIGLVYSAGSLTAGNSTLVTKVGVINVPSHGFTVGTPVWLSASGAVTNTAPSATLQAALKLGMVRDANNIEVQIGSPNIN